MRLWQTLRSLHLIFLIALVVGVLGLIEYRRTAAYKHLQERTHPRGHPRLFGQSLHELATVLLDLYPESAEPNLLMGTALAEQGKLAQARQYLEKSLAIERRNQGLLFLYARLLLDLGESPEAVKAVVVELGHYFPRSKEKMEDYFSKASKGAIRFDTD